MHLRITSDANVESGVGAVVDEMSGPTRQHFAPRNYGHGLTGLCVVLVCRDRELQLRRRVRFAKKERRLYVDEMLELDRMRHLSHEERRKLIVENLERNIPIVLAERGLPEFDQPGFVADLLSWLAIVRGEGHGVVPAA